MTSPSRILIVDDDQATLSLASKILVDAGHAVITAESAESALALLKNHPDISLAMIDAMMPQMDGYELVRTIRDDPAHENLPLLMMTRKRQREDVKKALLAGVSDYVTKPIDPTLLVEKIQTSLIKFAARKNCLELSPNEPAARSSLILPLSVISLTEFEILILSPVLLSEKGPFRVQLPIFDLIGIAAPALRLINCEQVEQHFSARFALTELSDSDHKKLRTWLVNEANHRKNPSTY